MSNQYDVFISHASQDKGGFVRPLAEALRLLGIKVWYDEFSLEFGDSISGGIDKGIAGAAYAIVVISPAFIERRWPQYELQGLVNRNVEEDRRIIPIWHGVSKKQVMQWSPSLADKLAINTRNVDAREAAIQILRIVRPDLYERHPRAELEKLLSGEAVLELQSEIEELRERIAEYQCPYCGAALSTRIDAPVDPEEKHWDVIETYDCGFETFGGTIKRPCPKDPRFPSFEDYEVTCDQSDRRSGSGWQCFAVGKTDMARKVGLDPAYGKSEEEARRKLHATYLYKAGKITNQEWIDSSEDGEWGVA